MTLTLALASLGLVVFLLLAGHSWWKARPLRPARMTLEETVSSRFEPAMGVGTGPDDAVSRAFADTSPDTGVDGAADRTARPATGLAALTANAAAQRKLLPRLDPLIDALVALRLEAPISGDMVLQHLPTTRRAGAKPFYIEGLHADTGEWEPIAAGHRYGELQAGVQMANRSGPLNEIEYSEFVQKVQDFAEAVGADADVPDMLDVVARARELDALSNPLDAQLNVTLRSNGVAWSVSFVQQLAARLGFIPGAVPGRMVLPGHELGAAHLLTLTVDAQAALAEEPQASAVSDCVLMLEVAQIDETQEPFPMFYRVVNELAAGLDASAVDNEGVPISLQAFATIGRELEELYAQLRVLDLAAGSPAARRLFS